MNQTCPSKQSLREFLEGDASQIESDAIIDHVSACSSCDQFISELESEQGPLLMKFREGLRIERLLTEPEFHQLRNTAEPSQDDTILTPDEHLTSEKRLRDYRLLKKIGEGGMGTVYQAVHVHLGKSVALKILPTDKLRSKQSVARFRQEMRAVGSVNHPNVVSASDAGSVDGQHFLVMELVEGADLARIIHDREPLNVADACEIVRQAAVGLQHAHDNGLVHRDVKPSNLMLTIDGNVKVLDLGLAGLNSTELDSTANVVVTDRLTSVGQIMGTLDYMAPEQITASTQVDGRADVYALGATLFQLLTKRTPCGDRTADTPARIEAVLHKPPLEIATLRSDVPKELCALLRKMLAKAPHERPSTAGDVAGELSRFVSDADLVALAEACRTSLDMPSADIEITDDVSFVVSRTESRPADNPIAKNERSRSKRAWGVGLVSAILILVLLSVFTFRTPNGMVKIEFAKDANPAGVRVALEQDGETVKIVDASGGWEVRIAAGNYDIRLLDVTNRFTVDKQTLIVESSKNAKVKVTWLPTADAESLFSSGKFEDGARAAEAIVSRQPDHGWNHARAAMMWGAVPLIGGNPRENRDNYERHRTWLAKRWKETGEGANTIPRICCLYPDARADLRAMLKAVTREAEQHPRDWRYPHSRMMLLYRLEKYEDALAAFRDCRRVSPTNRMHAAVDHAWSTMILYRLGRIDEGLKDHAKSLEMYRELRPYGQRELPKMWFDFVELGIVLCELSLEFEHAPDWGTRESKRQEPSFPTSACPNNFRLVKWRAASDTIMDAKLAVDGKSAIFALGWRPGAYELWKLGEMQKSLLVVNKEHVVRRQEGQPIRSVAFHPTKPIAALGRWYGVVEIVDLETNNILAAHESSIGKLRKANSVTFTDDGRHLLIGYQSNRLVVWDWQADKVVNQKNFPWPVWQVRLSPSQDEVLVRGQIWNWRTGKSTELVTDQILEGQWSTDGTSVLLPAEKHLNVFNVRTGEKARTYAFEQPVARLVCLRGGTRVIIGHDNGTLRLLDLHSGDSIPLGQMHENHGVGYLALDEQQRLLLTATGKPIDRSRPKDHQIGIWSIGDNLRHKLLNDLKEDSVVVGPWNLRVKKQIEKELPSAP